MPVPGVFSRLFQGSAAPSPPRVESIAVTVYGGDETLEVVGESHYQAALWTIVGGRRESRVRYETRALLVPEFDNDYDPNAIRVLIDGHQVGHLSREDAARYRPGLLKLMDTSTNELVALHAVIVGGGVQSSGGLGYLGVFLDHNPADFGLSVHPPLSPGVRTGMSEAIATDSADDSYDVSWHAQLSEDDVIAVSQLRSLLGEASQPIDRHYVLTELERRLYRCRDKIATALDDFDAVCLQHHQEMDTIRPALVNKFGAVPVIDMYRQAAIRCEKAKLWQASREWAERGIRVYGDDAARSEVVEDLASRVARASAQSERVKTPRQRQPRREGEATALQRPTEIESLVCSGCGTTFERTRTRGRKPRFCPACRVN